MREFCWVSECKKLDNLRKKKNIYIYIYFLNFVERVSTYVVCSNNSYLSLDQDTNQFLVFIIRLRYQLVFGVSIN